MSNNTVFIEDGLTLDGYIAERQGLHGSLAFTYRAMFIFERNRMHNAVRAEPDEELASKMAAMVVKDHLVEWDARREGKPAPIDEERILRLHPELFNRLYSVIIMTTPSDARPTARHGTNGSSDRDLHAEAALKGRSLQELLTKNLPEESLSNDSAQV